MNTKTWIIVANKKQARLFEKKRLDPKWSPVTIFDHAHKDHQKEKGQTTTGHTSGTKSLVDENGHARHNYDHFFHEITNYLNKGRTQNLFARLLIVAEGDTLGAIRAGLDKETEKLIIKSVAKDLGHHTQKELEEYLKEDFIYSGNLHP